MKNLSAYLIVLITLVPCSVMAQEQTREIELSIGDTLEFGPCEGENYTYIDLYSKTRFEENDLTYDSLTGEGFYDYFFSTGDFDIHRLPCDYSGVRCVITAVNSITDDSGNQRLVIFATIEAGKKVAWIETQPAFNAGEVIWQK